jgi:hypothetical protein
MDTYGHRWHFLGLRWLEQVKGCWFEDEETDPSHELSITIAEWLKLYCLVSAMCAPVRYPPIGDGYGTYDHRSDCRWRPHRPRTVVLARRHHNVNMRESRGLEEFEILPCLKAYTCFEEMNMRMGTIDVGQQPHRGRQWQCAYTYIWPENCGEPFSLLELILLGY